MSQTLREPREVIREETLMHKPILEAVAEIKTPDFGAFLEARRQAIKTMVKAYVLQRTAEINEKRS